MLDKRKAKENMEPENTFDTIKRLNLACLKLDGLVKVRPKNDKPFFAKIVSIEYLRPDATWATFVIGVDKNDKPIIIESNLLHVESISPLGENEIVDFLNKHLNQ